MPFPPFSFGDVAADFAGAQNPTLGGGGGPSESGDIVGGALDFGSVNIPGITRGFDLNSPVFLITAAVVVVVIFSAMRK